MIPIGYIGKTTHRLELQEVPEDGAITEPSPETAPAEVLSAPEYDQAAAQLGLSPAAVAALAEARGLALPA